MIMTGHGAASISCGEPTGATIATGATASASAICGSAPDRSESLKLRFPGAGIPFGVGRRHFVRAALSA
jgi:hypothetical protein